MPATEPAATISTLEVTVWPDPVVDQVGHDPRSVYVERFWLSILGPSTTLLLRRLADELERSPDGFAIDVPEVARSMGLGMKGGRHSPFLRAIDRTCQFGLGRFEGRETLAVRRKVPPLTRRQTERLPIPLQVEHRSWLEQRLHQPTAAELRTRARRLALTLLELGEDPATAERTLHRWRFHPALAYDAVAWARERQAAGGSGGTPPERTPGSRETPVAARPGLTPGGQ